MILFCIAVPRQMRYSGKSEVGVHSPHSIMESEFYAHGHPNFPQDPSKRHKLEDHPKFVVQRAAELTVETIMLCLDVLVTDNEERNVTCFAYKEQAPVEVGPKHDEYRPSFRRRRAFEIVNLLQYFGGNR